MSTAPDLDAITETLFACAERGDWVGFRSRFRDDAVLAQNVARPLPIDEALPGLRAFTDNGLELRYENARRFTGADHVTELHDAVFTRPNGREIRVNICVVLQFDEQGQIIRADEYLDSGAAAALFRD